MNAPSKPRQTSEPVLSTGQPRTEATGSRNSTAIDPEPAGWLPAANLLRPQGRRGELLADPLTDLPEVFTPGRLFRLGENFITLESSWRPHGRNASRLVLKLAGVDSITAAEALAGQQLSLPLADLPALEPGAFLVRDLTGCTVFDHGQLLGTVTDLHFPVAPDGRTRLPDAPDLLVLQRPSGDEVLIPFVKAWLQSVNLAAKQIHMHLPPGLLDPEDESAPVES